MKKIEIINNTVFCNSCNKFKDLTEFYIYNTIKRPCKDCKKQYQSNFFKDNKSAISIKQKSHYIKNKDRIISKQLIRDSLRLKEIRLYQKLYRQKNKKKLNFKKAKYNKIRYKDPLLKLRRLVSNAIYKAIRSKEGSFLNKIGYSLTELKQHLESQFETWMNWDNWKSYSVDWDDDDISTWSWNIDHIIPQAKLPYSSMDDENFKLCWNLKNLRPYSAKQNILDGCYRS